MWANGFRQLLSALLTLWVVLTLTFFLMRLLPGGPFDRERQLPQAIQHNIQAYYGLDRPLIQQYTDYVGHVLHGNLGPSFTYQSRSVGPMVVQALGVSAGVGTLAILLGLLLGITLGTWAGISRLRAIRQGLATLGMLALSVPSFVAAGGLVLVFSLGLRWLPAATLQSPSHYVLPVCALALGPFALTMMLVQTAVEQVKTLPYVAIKRTAGLSESLIIGRHVLRNALLPVVSMLGPIAAALLTGSFVVETLFAIPGLGKYFVTAVTNRDYPLVMGITLTYSVLLLVFNMLSEALMSMLDPRLKTS